MFKAEFGDRAVKRIEAIMAIVDEMYSEKDTLKTELEVKTVAIEHAEGKNWGLEDWISNFSPWSRAKKPEYDLSKIATDSPHDANIYVFITGRGPLSGLGLATLDSVCDSQRTRRVNINKYSPGDIKGGDAYTAEVCFKMKFFLI